MKNFYLLGAVAAAAISFSASAADTDLKTWPKNVLLEQFTTIRCSNCPQGDKNLEVATKGRTDIVWIAHHVGYYTDELTVSDSQELQAFGINFAPAALISRTPFLDPSTNTYALPVGTAYANATQGGAILAGDFNTVVANEANVAVDIEMKYNPVTRRIRATVNLERNEDLPKDALLTVQVAENGVYASVGQAGSNTHGHNHVYRKSLTKVLGDEITWSDNKSTTEYELDLPETWSAERVYVIAFVNQPIDRRDIYNNEVHNAISSGYFYTPSDPEDEDDKNAIETVNASAASAAIALTGGCATVGGSTEGVSVYTLQGAQVANSALAPGLYLVNSPAASGKLLVK